MNPLKQYKKIQKLIVRAQECTSREDAQKILKKESKAQAKLSSYN